MIDNDGAVLVMMVNVEPGNEESFNRWYDEEQIPEMRLSEVERSPLSMAGQSLGDLANGKVVGPIVLEMQYED